MMFGAAGWPGVGAVLGETPVLAITAEGGTDE